MNAIRPLRLPAGSAVLVDVRAAIAAGPGRPADILRRIGRWSRFTVQHALADLVTLGEIVAEGPASARVYRAADRCETSNPGEPL